LKIDNDKYNQLMSYYSIPNIIGPFIAGVILDKIGIRMYIYIIILSFGLILTNE
jgi:MFS family permease